MKTIFYNKINSKRKLELLQRPSINTSKIYEVVQPILNEVKLEGLSKVLEYSKKLDDFNGDDLLVEKKEIEKSAKNVDKIFKKAVEVAARNIYYFHKNQLPKKYSIKTMEGVKCSREFRAIENVGLYIPGGTAKLPSTLLMLAIPAKIAGCKRIVVCSPTDKDISPEVLFVAKILGITEIYKTGGAQAIGLMAYGTNKIPKVDKIFGPGNQFVQAAKALVSIDPSGCSIDMIAGPSEVLVIADDSANPNYIAADLLSQAEHGADSQVILCTTSKNLAAKVEKKIKSQLENLPRKSIAQKALGNSCSIIFNSLNEAVQFSNSYAPEHLILNFKDVKKYIQKIQNAGSVFIGKYSTESIGDYASGTNHSLPTNGYAKSVGGVSVEQFLKGITFQEISKKGLNNISQTVVKMAEAEKLQAHANAVKIRLTK